MIFLLVLLVTAAVGTSCKKKDKDMVTVYVFHAASLKNAMDQIQKNYKETAPKVELILNGESSGTLQTQIEEGAECDVFFSAAAKQMDALEKKELLVPDSTVSLLENKVVLIKAKDADTAVTGFLNLTNAKNLALAGEEVPVGGYAREIFESMGMTHEVMSMEINEGSNVTAVLTAVSEGSNEIGIVYATDAYSMSDRVSILAEAPKGSLKTLVVYPAALVKNSSAHEAQTREAEAFLEYLSGEQALKVFESYGFTQYKN